MVPSSPRPKGTTPTRSSTGTKVNSSSEADSAQDNADAASSNIDVGTKRKPDVARGESDAKRGKTGDQKQQMTIEDSLRAKSKDDVDQDLLMGEECLDKREEDVKDKEISSKTKAVSVKSREDSSMTDEFRTTDQGTETSTPESSTLDPPGAMNVNDSPKIKHGKNVPEFGAGPTIRGLEANEEENPGVDHGPTIREECDGSPSSSERSAIVPASILEKGLIYFFFRGRVGIDEPGDVQDLARSYIVLKPLPHGAKVWDGPINGEGKLRLLALPKKVLPANERDRFMTFVEKTKSTTEDIKKSLAASNYMTKTAGARHTPSATPIGEGVYAITEQGQDSLLASHLAYILTRPSEIGEVQKDVGLCERGSFVLSVKNPQYSGPANTNLPQGPKYPQEILDEFGKRRWMPLRPKLLDYENTQFILIGSNADNISKATEQQPEDKKKDKETPLEEMEKMEEEDVMRVEHLKGDAQDFIFENLGTEAKGIDTIVKTSW